MLLTNAKHWFVFHHFFHSCSFSTVPVSNLRTCTIFSFSVSWISSRLWQPLSLAVFPVSLTLLVNVDLLFCRISSGVGFLTVTLELCIISKDAEGHFPPFSLWALSKHRQLLWGPLSPMNVAQAPCRRKCQGWYWSWSGEHRLSVGWSDGSTREDNRPLFPPWLQGLIWLCSVNIQTQRPLSLWPRDSSMNLWCCGSPVCPLLIRPDTWNPTETSVMGPALSPVSLRSSAGWFPSGTKRPGPQR